MKLSPPPASTLFNQNIEEVTLPVNMARKHGTRQWLNSAYSPNGMRMDKRHISLASSDFLDTRVDVCKVYHE